MSKRPKEKSIVVKAEECVCERRQWLPRVGVRRLREQWNVKWCVFYGDALCTYSEVLGVVGAAAAAAMVVMVKMVLFLLHLLIDSFLSSLLSPLCISSVIPRVLRHSQRVKLFVIVFTCKQGPGKSCQAVTPIAIWYYLINPVYQFPLLYMLFVFIPVDYYLNWCRTFVCGSSFRYKIFIYFY